MSFFSPKSELGLVFDIGSSSVGGALVRLSHGEPAMIVHSLREFLPYQETVDPDRLFKDMIAALSRIYQAVIKEGASHLSNTEFKHVDVRRAYFSFSSPWSATETRTLSIKKEKPFTFTHDMLNGLMLDEETRFKKEAMGERKVLPEALTIVERRIIQTKLNGYDVKDPFDKRAREADISYFSGIVPKSILEKVTEISHISHAGKRAKYFTFTLAAYSGVRDSFAGESDFVSVRIGGEISDVSIIEDGIIAESASFPRGQNPIAKAFAQQTGQTMEEALSFLQVNSAGHADQAKAKEYEQILDGLLDEWAKSLLQVLESLAGSRFLPQRVFLFMDGDMAPYFINILKLRSFDPVLLSADDLKQAVRFEASARKDALLAVAAAFGKRIYESEKK